MSRNNHISFPQIYFGADPELFISKEGKIVGSERVIPTKGLGVWSFDDGPRDKIIIDGVQVELNPSPATCREALASSIARAMWVLREHLKKADGGFSANFSGVVEVPQAELDTLSDHARTLGCAPSESLYGATTIDAALGQLPQRSAGGHIHIGTNHDSCWGPPDQLVRLLDILVGNTCVMIDRDPMAPIRRQQYGRAGEYRLPKHGVEYRTLSNFWLRSYPLMSLVFGLARIAVGAAYTERYPSASRGKPASDLIDALDPAKVAFAINANDLTAAKENWAVVKAWIHDRIMDQNPVDDDVPALWPSNLAKFELFLLRDHPALDWFPDDPIEHWSYWGAGGSTPRPGWERWLDDRIKLVRVPPTYGFVGLHSTGSTGASA